MKNCAWKYVCEQVAPNPGKCLFSFPFLFSVKALMTLPKADNDLLIILASSNVCPLAPVLEIISLPAKSTKHNLPCFVLPVVVSFW